MAKKQTTALTLVGVSREEVYETLTPIAPSMMTLLRDQEKVARLQDLVFYLSCKTPQLRQCTQSSFRGAVYQCCKMNLWPDTRGQAWIIPRRTGPVNPETGEKSWEAHFQPGYQGLLELARRSREIAKIEARVVYSNDQFEYQYGTEPFIKHKPARGEDRGELSASYAVAWLVNSKDPQFVVMEATDINRIKKSAQGTSKADSPWNKHPEAMWMKSAIVPLAKFLPASVELLEAAMLDERSTAEVSQNIFIPGIDQQADFMEVTDASQIPDKIGVDDLMPTQQGTS